jgi:DNA topoisomerase-2
MYIGDLNPRNDLQFIYKNNKIIQEKITWIPGLYKIIDELIVNTYDQTIRDKTVNNIDTEINKESFSIFNDGIGIDVVKHPDHKIYIPELIFGNLLTSTNYDEKEDRITGGTHGLGAKLTAIFSLKFIIEVWDKKRHLYYKQFFENNLSKINKPIIEKCGKDLGGVKITVYPDFIKFNIKYFSEDIINLIKKRIVDLCNKNINIKINNKLLKINHYLDLYESEHKWIIGTCVKNNLWEYAIRFNDSKNITPGTHISFVNGIYTNRNGKHVDYIIDLLFDKLQKLISPDFTKKLLNDYTTIYLKTSIIF